MVTTTTPNTDALGSAIYNPDIDPTSLQIFNIMGNNYPDDLMAQYREMITGMPTSNPFSGVLANPRSCDVSQAQSSIAEAQSGLGTLYANVVAQGTAVPSLTPTGTGTTSTVPGTPGYQPSPQQAADMATWQAAMPAVSSDLDQANQSMADFQDHTDRAISNLPAILGMVQSALGIATKIGGLLDPCLGISDFMGSIMGKGKGMMAKINAAIANVTAIVKNAMAAVTSAIGEVMSAVKAAIAKVTALVSALTALVQAEITKLIKSLIDSARLGLAQLLGSLPKDPCFKSLTSSIGTGALAGVVAGTVAAKL